MHGIRQRYFVLQKHPKWHDIQGNEVKYAIDAIRAEPENEMPWTYLKCLVSGKNYEVLNNSSTFVLSDVVRHINDGKVDIRDAYVKRRVVNALKMVLFAIKRNDFKPNHDLKTNIDYLSTCNNRAQLCYLITTYVICLNLSFYLI